ncbi:hypothetical protein Tco_1547266 [Tanacetum coccineum]
MKIHHAGKFKELEKMRYVNGLVAYVDGFDIDQFSVHELNVLMEELGYVNDDPIYYHYMIPETDLDIGLRALGNNLDLDPEPLPANANTTQNETVESIVQELLSMDYEFDPFEDNMTAGMNDQPSVNEQEKYRDDNYEPVETLVERETLAEDDDNMADYHFNIDAEVEWVRHSNCGQQQDHEPIPGELDVIDNDYFDSGTDSEDDGIEKIRRNKLKEIKKANESADNIVRKLFLAKNDKLRIRAKCLGKIHVFTLDGEGPSNTKEAAPKKKTTKVKGKKDVGPSDPVGPNKKGVSLGGRGRPKPLAADEYPWALQISKVKNTKTWEVKTYTDEHKCLQSREIHACTSKFLSKGIVEQIEKDPDIPIRALQDELQKKYELGVSRMKAFKAKSAALNQVKGDYSQQYTMLRDYCLELRRANPDTTIKIEVERDSDTDLQTRVFKRIYICLGPLKKGFKACGRDLLGLDGAFMKGPYPGQLLTTVGLDGNNGIYPLAYAIVEKETTCSWIWFLECLGDDLEMTRESNFTFISITIAMTNVSPCTEHKYCLRPIHENMKKQWNGQAYKELLWRCVAATTIPYFDKAIEELKQFNKQAFEWLAKIPAHSWSRSHFSGRAKSDILLNNLCEYFNGEILDARDAHIITDLEYIREYLMRRMVNVIVVINKTDGPLTPSTTKLLKVAMDKANKYTVGFNEGKSMRSCKGQKDPMNETCTSTSQRSTNAAADTRKRPSDAGNAPANKKQSTTSSNAGTTPAKKKQTTTGSGQKRITRSDSDAAQKQKKNGKSLLYFVPCVMIDHYVAFPSFHHCRGVTEEVHEIREALGEQCEVMDVMARDLSRFTVWAAGGISQLLDSVGATYIRYSETHVPYQRCRVRQRTECSSGKY